MLSSDSPTLSFSAVGVTGTISPYRKTSVPAANETANMMNHLDDLNSTNLGRLSFDHQFLDMRFCKGENQLNSQNRREVGQIDD